LQGDGELDPTNWDALRFLLDVIQVVGIVGLGLYTFLTQRSKANAEQLEEHGGKLNDHAKKLVSFEERLKAAPGHDDLKRVNENAEKLIAFEERLKAAPDHDDIEKLHDRVSKIGTSVNRVEVTVAKVDSAVEGLVRNLDLLNRSHIGDGK